MSAGPPSPGPKPRAMAVELLRLVKFGALGAVATGVHMAVAVGLTTLLAMNPYLANLVAFLLAFLVSYAGHYYVTFAGLADRFLGPIRAFFVIAALGFLANNGLLLWLLGRHFLGESQALIIAALIVPAISFLAARFWAFAPRR